MALDVAVGMFLCTEDWHDPGQAERYLAEVNASLRRLGRPEHREPRSLADIDPPLPAGTDPCGLGTRLGFYSAEKYQRFATFARHLAVHGTVPPAAAPYDLDTERRYDALPDRRKAFDHAIATTFHESVVLPQPFDEVTAGSGQPAGHGLLVSAHRLRAESVALAHAFRYADSPVHDWVTGSTVEDAAHAHLDARVEDDPAVVQAWANEADLCHRLLTVAHDVLRTGALGVTG